MDATTIDYGLFHLYPSGAPVEDGARLRRYDDVVAAWTGDQDPPTESALATAGAEALAVKDNLFRALDVLYPSGAPVEAGATVRTRDELASAWTGQDAAPTQQQLDDALATADARRQVLQQLRTKRAEIRAEWEDDSLTPPHVRGPFRAAFREAAQALDEGEVADARAIIEFAEAPAGYTSAQLADWTAVRDRLLADLDEIETMLTG